MVWILIVAVLLAIDQLTKAWVTANISLSESITVIDDFFYLVHRVNTGGAWSLFADRTWGMTMLTIVSALASIAIVVMLIKWKDKPVRACLAVILAGSAGNLIDRVLYKEVTDFLSFHFGNYVFPTFNVADICLVCGTITLCLFMLLHPEWLAHDREHKTPSIRSEGCH